MYIMPKKYKSKNKFRPCVGNKLHPDKNLLKVGSNVRDLHAVAILHVHEPISSTLLQLKQAPSCQKKKRIYTWSVWLHLAHPWNLATTDARKICWDTHSSASRVCVSAPTIERASTPNQQQATVASRDWRGSKSRHSPAQRNWTEGPPEIARGNSAAWTQHHAADALSPTPPSKVHPSSNVSNLERARLGGVDPRVRDGDAAPQPLGPPRRNSHKLPRGPLAAGKADLAGRSTSKHEVERIWRRRRRVLGESMGKAAAGGRQRRRRVRSARLGFGGGERGPRGVRREARVWWGRA
jgi:hypothetical protein